MKQVIVIHGGTTFSDYDKYLQYLSTKKLNIERFMFKPMWKELLQQKLGNDYLVLLPTMPNATNARYDEWKTWFDHLTSIMTDGCVLVGHSLGAIFLAKYLSENTFPVNIKATILIAAPYDDETIEDLTDFKIKKLSDQLTDQAGRIVFFAGADDPVVSVSDMHKYQRSLPSAEFKLLPAPDHFVRVEFPELVTLLKEI